MIGAPFGDLHHLVDAAARRIHLHAQLAICRAGVQAETAMNATVQVEGLGLVGGMFKYGCRVCHDSITGRGSNLSLIRHMTSKSCPAAGHSSSEAFGLRAGILDDRLPTGFGALALPILRRLSALAKYGVDRPRSRRARQPRPEPTPAQRLRPSECRRRAPPRQSGSILRNRGGELPGRYARMPPPQAPSRVTGHRSDDFPLVAVE